MAISIALERQTTRGDAKRTTNLIAGDASYPTGGYTILPAQLGFASRIAEVIEIDFSNLAAAAYIPILTRTLVNNRITQIQFQLAAVATGAEVAAATNVSAASYLLVAEGN